MRRLQRRPRRALSLRGQARLVEKEEYVKAVGSGAYAGEVDLGMHAVFVHGDEVISDSKVEDGYAAACAKFKKWVNENWPKTAVTA